MVGTTEKKRNEAVQVGAKMGWTPGPLLFLEEGEELAGEVGAWRKRGGAGKKALKKDSTGSVQKKENMDAGIGAQKKKKTGKKVFVI